MPAFNAGTIIIAILCCILQVHCEDPVISFKYYELKNRELIVENNNVDETSIVYALCEGNHQSTTKCTIKSDTGAFDDSKRKWSCDYELKSKYENGIIDVLQVHHWPTDKAIFIWQDRENDDAEHAQLTLRSVYLRSCQSMEYKVKVDVQKDAKPQLFVMRYEYNYDVAFLHKEKCGDNFCKITVSGREKFSQNLRWFPNAGLVHAIETTDSPSSKLLVYFEAGHQRGQAKLYLMDESTRIRLESYDEISNLGWSTSNSIISFCNSMKCVQTNHAGKSKTSTELKLSHTPTRYAALYNLPGQEHLALVCDTNPNDDHYRIIKIGADGYEQYSYALKKFECSRKPKIMISKFFNGNNGEYCLSIFSTINNRANVAKLTTYCFFT